MKGIAIFEKVSQNQFRKSMADFGLEDEKIDEIYKEIKLPRRATVGSAGYDFFSTLDFELKPGEEITVPTGIRVKIDEGWVLCIYPRSGLGFKFRLRLNNTVGIIDSDYYRSDNEGHIFVKLSIDAETGKTISVRRGDGFVQGIFTPFGITVDDDAKAARNGGFGSTS